MGRIKSLAEIKAEVRDHTGKKKIFRRARKEDVESVLANLTSKDPGLWAAEWSRVAQPYEDLGAGHEQAGQFNEARAAYLQAYTYYATGRYPVPHTPGKMRCLRKSLELYEKAGRYFEPALERVEIPFGDKIIPAYLRLRRWRQASHCHQLWRHRWFQSRGFRVRGSDASSAAHHLRH